MLKLAAICLALAGCGPMARMQSTFDAGAAPAPAPAPAAESEPVVEVDDRTAGQVIVDIMAGEGYACSALETSWECLAPNDRWYVYVSYHEDAEGSTTIWFDSWLERAFAQPCHRFGYAIRDLADADNAFTASCDDSVKKFRFNTAVNYGSELDVMAWVHDHEARRAQAGGNLRGIHALSRESAQFVVLR